MVWLSLLQPDGTSALQGWVGLHLQEGPGSKLNPPLSHRTGPLGRATSLPQEAGLRKRGRWASHLDSPPRPAPVRLRWLQCLNRTGTWGLGPHWSNSWQQKVTSELQNMPEASFKGGKERLNTDRDVRGDLKMRICTASPPVEVLTRGGAGHGRPVVFYTSASSSSNSAGPWSSPSWTFLDGNLMNSQEKQYQPQQWQ